MSEPGFIRTADEVDLFYRDWGEGEPVVFVASWSLPSDMWNYRMLALSEQGYRCVGFDPRGHGRSSDPGHGFDYDALAGDLAAVLEALDPHGVTLVGHSMGCAVIVRYLTRHGSDRVARIALLGTTTPLLLRTADNPDGIDASYFEAFRRDELMRDYPKWIEDIMPNFTPNATPQMQDWLRGLSLQASAKAMLDTNRALTTEDFREELPKITVPTLVIHGDEDVGCPIDITARRTAELAPSAKLKVYAPVYSEATLDSPEMSAVRGAVRQVLRGHEPYSAVVVDRGWNLIDANAGVALLTDGVAQELLAPPANVLRVSLHPDGMAPRIVNLGEWRAHLLGRLRRRVALTTEPELVRLLDELRAYPCEQPEPEVEVPEPGDIVVALRIRYEGRELAFFSTVATFGTPLDVTVAELAIESFFPAEPGTASVLRQRG